MICIYAVWMGIDADFNTELLITDAQAAAVGWERFLGQIKTG